MHKWFRGYLQMFVLVLVLLANGTAAAEIITIYFTGTVGGSLIVPPELDGVIEDGDAIEGSFTIDTNRSDSDSRSTIGVYSYLEAGFGMRAQVGDAYIESLPSAPNLTVQVLDDHILGIAPEGMDRFGVMSFENSALSPATVAPAQFHFFLEDRSKTAFDTDAIPPLPLDPSTFERAFGQIATSTSQSPQVFINFSIETLTADVETLPVSLRILPRTINLKRRGQSVTAHIESNGYDVAAIDPGSIMLEGVAAESVQLLAAKGRGRDQARMILAKFGQGALAPYLAVGMSEVEVTGTLFTGETIQGTDVVRVINTPNDGPLLQPDGPRAVVLEQNVPNPFNPTTSIHYTTSERQHVRIAVFDVGGNLVRVLVDEMRDPGAHVAQWNGRDRSGRTVSSGGYFYRLETGNVVESRKMIMLK